MDIGGVQRVALEIFARADRARFDYALLCIKDEGVWADRVRQMGFPFHFERVVPGHDPFKILRLARLLRRVKPDVIHIHMATTVLPVATAARLAGVPHVVIQHHNVYHKHWAKQGALLRNWEWWLTRRADAVIGVSDEVARATLEAVGVAPEKMHRIPNGIDLDLYRSVAPRDPRPEWGIAPDTPLIVYVARLAPQKRIEDFIEAASIIAKRWDRPTPKPVFVVAGGGKDKALDKYEQLIREKNVQDIVRLVGPRDDIPSILPFAQAGVLCSEMEGFGLVVLEYMASGVPAIVSDLPCLRELVRDNENGLVIPQRRPDLLAEKIKNLLDDKALSSKLIAEGRDTTENYDWLKIVRDYEAIYTELLEPGT